MSLLSVPEIESDFPAANAEFLSEEDWAAQDRLLGNTARLGIAWTASGLAAWVGKNLASGVVSAVGGMAFGEALKAIGLGGPDVGAMLQDISKRLAAVEQTVTEIKSLVLQLLQELEALRLSMDQSFLEGEIRTAFAQIDAACGTPDSPRLTGDVGQDSSGHAANRPAPSFLELLTSSRKCSQNI